MPIHAGHAAGSTGSPDLANLSAFARMVQGSGQEGAVPQPGQSTDGGLDVSTLLASLKGGQVSPQQLLQMLSLLLGQGVMGGQPQGNMSAIQNAGQGGPPQGAQSPVMAAMMGGAGPQGVAGS